MGRGEKMDELTSLFPPTAYGGWNHQDGILLIGCHLNKMYVSQVMLLFWAKVKSWTYRQIQTYHRKNSTVKNSSSVLARP